MLFKSTLIFSLTFVFIQSNLFSQPLYLTGVVTDSVNTTAIQGVNVFIENTNIGGITDVEGRFCLIANKKTGRIVFQHIAYEKNKKKFLFKACDSIHFNIRLAQKVLVSEELFVEAEMATPEIAGYKIKEKNIRELASPVPDPMQAIKILPGVASQNDQTNFFNARGGNYDENLIRINGFIIYQPQIVRKGFLENPSLVNPLMVKRMNLNLGNYSVLYSDKLSSVLDIEYAQNSFKKTTFLFDIGTTGFDGVIKFQPSPELFIMAGWRKTDYGYLFKSALKRGVYLPFYQDFQTSGIYRPYKKVSFSWQTIHAKSEFRFLPQTYTYTSYYTGYHNFIYNDSKQDYKFDTSLLGVKLKYSHSNKFYISCSASIFRQDEIEHTALSGLLRYTPHPWIISKPDSMLLNEYANSKFRGVYYNARLNLHTKNISYVGCDFGIEWNSFDISSFISQYNYSVSRDTILVIQPSTNFALDMKNNSSTYSVYGQLKTILTKNSFLRLGLRGSLVEQTDEQLLMYRALLGIKIRSSHYLTVSAGSFSQPPVYKELLHQDEGTNLKSQKSTVFTFGVDGPFWWKTQLKAQAYYKSLSDLISYRINDVQVIYSGENDSKGRIYGFDMQLGWKPAKDLTNRLSYSFLSAREDIVGDSYGYLPMPSERKHQLSFFAQDKMSKFKNSFMYLRILYGTGFPYTPQSMRFNEETNTYMVIKAKRNSGRTSLYGRFDVGFTQQFEFRSGLKISLREEVLNLFNHFNVLSYSYTPWNTRVKNKMGGRYYNIRISMQF